MVKLKLTDLIPSQREKKAAQTALSVAASGSSGIAALPRAERCGALIVAHAIVRSAAAIWGPEAASRPSAMPRRTLVMLIEDLAAARERLISIIADMDGKGMKDGDFAGIMRQLRATEAALLIYGAVLSPAISKAMAACWKLLWASRNEAPAALRLLRAYEQDFGTDAVPNPSGGPYSDDDLIGLAQSLPPLFRRKKTRPKAGRS